MLLVGDMGGTYTRLALCKDKNVLCEKKFSSKAYSGPEEIIREFIEAEKIEVERACLGVAGPVYNGKCKATNLPWVVDTSHLSQTLKIPFIRLVNDLVAHAFGIQSLKKEELYLLQEGSPHPGANQALIAAGTGLGEAGLFWDGERHRPFPCEGGHADFAPRNSLECELLIWFQKRYRHVSYERVVSGPGLFDLYRFLIETGQEEESVEVKEQIREKDPPAVISEWGRLRRDPACMRAVDWFLSLYGAEAGNLALKMLALGGIFIAGGIGHRFLDDMKKGSFLLSFREKGRFKEMLESIPIWVVLNDHTALIGAAYLAEN